MSWAAIVGAAVGAGGSAIAANNSGGGGGGGGGGQAFLGGGSFPAWLWQGILGMMDSNEQQRVMDEVAARSDQQQADATGVAGEMGPETLATYDASSNEALRELEELFARQTTGASGLFDATRAQRRDFLGDFERRNESLMSGYGRDMQDFLGGFGTESADILGGYDDRYLRAEADLEGYGDQMRADIDRSFDEEQARNTMSLMDRGLLSSTEATTEFGGTTERRTAEQRRLAEQLALNRVNVLGGMSGERLAAQERLGAQSAGYEYGGINNAFGTQASIDASYAAYDAAMRADNLAAMRYMQDVDAINSGNLASFYGNEAANRSNIVNSGYGSMLNTIMGFQNIPPPQSNLPYQFGQNAGGSPYAGNPYAGFIQQAGQGLGQGLYNWMNQPQQPNQPYPLPQPLPPHQDPYYYQWEPDAYNMAQWNNQMATNTYSPPSNSYVMDTTDYPIMAD